jgi:glycosyltransferase involved in cell wall biosynthesis
MTPHIVCVGGEDHALRIPFLLSIMRERGYRVTAVSTSDGSAFADAKIPHHSYHLDRFSSGGGSDWAILRSLRRLMADLAPDLVQSFDTKPNLLVPFALRGAAAVVRTINGLGWVFSSTEPRALALRAVFCALQVLASRWTAATVFQNREDQAFFGRHGLLGSTQSKLISSSGIDSDAFALAQKKGPSPEQLRAQLGLHDAEIVIYVGRLTRQKGLPTLLKAVPLVLAQRPSARFVLVGPLESEGPFAVDSASIDCLRPYVISLGRRQDVPALLGIANVFVFPTEYREGIPRVLLEAGLAGLPMIASRMPGCNDVITHGYNGYLVPPKDPLALSTHIIDLLRNPQRARKMGVHSFSVIRQRFELAHVVEEYCTLYDTILSVGRSRGPDNSGLTSTLVGSGGAAQELQAAQP